jgi:sulfite exporter TauE/SafE
MRSGRPEIPRPGPIRDGIPIVASLLAAAFLLGFAGGVHCVVMCGGIVAALHLRVPRTFGRQLAYSAGRIASYTMAGAVAGAIGGAGILYGGALPVRITLLALANLLIVLLGLHLAGIGRFLLLLERVGGRLWRRLGRFGLRLAPAGTLPGAFAVGLLWGWIPCGLVYAVLGTALLSGSAGGGALVMAAFGIGTLPNLLAAGFAAERLGRIARRPGLRRAAGITVIVIGLAGFWRLPALAGGFRRHGPAGHAAAAPPR